jgi:hypothetical protein
MGGQTLSRPAVFRPRIRRAVALLGGNMDELPLLRAAYLAGSMQDASVQLCWIEGKPSPSRPLIRGLALDAHLGDVSPEGLADLLDSGRVSSVMLAPTLWRQLATRLWRRLHGTSAYICRQASLPPASVLCCADSERTAAGLLDRLRIVLPEGATRFTLLRALPPPPSWVPGMLAVAGCALPPEDGPPACFASTPRIRELIIRATPAVAAAAAYSEVQPDLLVVGWHEHRLPLPGRWLHPTAWRLSTSFPSDLLLVPLGP